MFTRHISSNPLIRPFARTTLAAAWFSLFTLPADVVHAGVDIGGALAPHALYRDTAGPAGNEWLTGGTAELDASISGASTELTIESRYQWPGHDEEPREDHRLRQAYLDVYGTNYDLRVGRQVIIWGRTDRFNPTDNLTPADFEYNNLDDQGHRFGVDALQARYFVSNSTTLTAVAIADFAPGRLPEALVPDNRDIARIAPDVSGSDPQYALKLDYRGRGFDVAASYYRGFDTRPGLTMSRPPNPWMAHPEIEVVGVDGAVTKGGWIYRAELAHTAVNNPRRFIGDTGPHDSTELVQAVERELGGGHRLIVQWLYRRVDDHVALSELPSVLRPAGAFNDAVFGQFDAEQHGATFSWRGTFINDNLETELSGARWFERDDYALQFKAEYAISDNWRLGGFIEAFRGPPDSPFGALRDHSRTFIELRRYF